MTSERTFWLLVLAVVVWVTGLGSAIVLAERPTGSIVGKVRAKEGGPLSQARLVITGEGEKTRQVLTADDGSYRADHLPVGVYRIGARKRGFDSQWHEPEVEVKANQVAGDLDFALLARDPTAYFSNYQRVYLPGEKLRIITRGSLVEEMNLTLYRFAIDPVVLAKGTPSDLTVWQQRVTPKTVLRVPDLPPAIPPTAVVPIASFSAGVPAASVDEDDWFYRPIELPSQPEGTYLLTMQVRADQFVGTTAPAKLSGPGAKELNHSGHKDVGRPRLRDAYWFNISRLALVSKRSRKQLIVYASDFKTHRPIGQVDLIAHSGGGNVVAVGSTRKDGLWQVPMDTDADFIAISGRIGNSVAYCGTHHHSSDRLTVYSYTDRPIYRPGHTVHYKGIIRDTTGAEAKIPAVDLVTVTFRDPDGTNVAVRQHRISALGTWNGDVVLPAEGKTGTYSLLTEIKNDRYHTSLEVEAYRKPEIKVEVRAGKPRVVGGELQRVDVSATYYFGAPLVGAKVRYLVFARPDYSEWSAAEAFYAGYTDDHLENGQVVLEGEAMTDAAGHLAVFVPTKQIEARENSLRAYDQNYRVEVETADESRRLVKGRATFLVTRGLFRLEAVSNSYLVRTGTPVRVEVNARDYDGKPVRTPVRFVLLKELQDPSKEPGESDATKRDPVASFDGQTDETGKASAMLTPLAPGSYVTQVVATDARGNVIGTEQWFWAGAEDYTQTEGIGTLGVNLDKASYKSGDVAKILITSPIPNRTILLTVEGERLHLVHIATLRGSSLLFDLPVTAVFEPNVYVNATMVEGKELLSAEKSLNVLPSERFLEVAIVPNKARYLPGETASFRVQTRLAESGKPVSAEVSLGVVDEAIYALAPDRTPDIRRHFLGPRSATVTTSYSFPTEYSGGLAKDLGPVRVRKNFQDTAAWFPDLQTGSDGSAEVSFPLPENLTTWVATARGISARTEVGSAIHRVLATKDLLVRLEAPRFFLTGDELDLTTITHNYSESGQPVALIFDSGSLKGHDRAQRSFSLQPGGARREDFSVAVVGGGTASLVVKAGNRRYNDGMALDLPIYPFGVPEAKTWAKTVVGSGRFAFEIPSGSVPEAARLGVSLSPSPWHSLMAGLGYLQRYGYWCTEQTTSRLVPTALAAMGLPAQDSRRPQLLDQAAHAQTKLLSLQHSDGGWGWWEGGDSELELTAYALWGLRVAQEAARLQDSPLRTQTHTVLRGLEYLRRELKRVGKDIIRRRVVERGQGREGRAVGLWGLSHWAGHPLGIPSSASFDAQAARLWQERKGLTSYGWALLTQALGSAGSEHRGEAKNILEGRVKASSTMVHWEAGGGPFSWQNSDIEATAHAVLALARDPNHPLIPKAVRWLEMNRRGDRWMHTKDTAAALTALAATLPKQSGVATHPFEVGLAVDGKKVGIALADPGATGEPVSFLVDWKLLGPGRHEAELTTGQIEAYPFAAELRYVVKRDQIAPASGSLLAIDRDYFTIDKDFLAEARSLGLAALFSKKYLGRLRPAGGSVSVGARLVARLRVKSQENVRFIVIEDPLPSGAEVLDESAAWSVRDADTPNANTEFMGDGAIHRDILDDKIVFFADTLPKDQVHEFAYVLRPEMRGKFRVLPPVVEAMYAPDIRSHGSSRRLQIVE